MRPLFRPLLLFLLAASPIVAAEPRDISRELEVVRAKYKIPACASAVIEQGHITGLGAAGLRRADREVPVTMQDHWTIASCTKSMTAALIGLLVDAGKLRWDMPLPAALPEITAHPGWRKVTLWHLVTQRSGIPRMTRDQLFALDGEGSARDQRTRLAQAILVRPPAEPPGKFAYSNSGYGLLGAIIERASGQRYEDFLHARLFIPLGLKTADFGAPATPGQLDQPWGHDEADGRFVPVEPTPARQFPPALAPAGSVRMSLEDFARYAAWLSTGEPRLVTAEIFAHLQTPPPGSTYAGGLWKTVLPGVGGAALCHTGHLAGFSAVFHVGRDRACVSFFNVGGGGWEWLGEEIAAAALRAAP